MIEVVLLGAGNVAFHLYEVFSKHSEIKVSQWYNRTLATLSQYKNQVEITDKLESLSTTADVYILAVPDDVIGPLSTKLNLENKLVVHTSGSVSVHELDKKLRRGVFYPLQTFSKEAEIDFNNIPICIEALEKEDFKTLKTLAEIIESPVYKINTDQRQTLHLAAVYVNNFTNQLYRIAHEMVDAKHISFDILKPLILETAKKVETLSPYMAQTGPAKRNDKKTLKRHLKLIENPQHKEIYELLTQSIKKTHGR